MHVFFFQLYVPGCTSLTPDGVIKAVKLLTRNAHRLKSLRINGIHNINKEDLEILRGLIDEYQQKQEPILYHEFNRFTTFRLQETSPSLDIDLCPKCDEVRAVFDCPRDSCKRKNKKQRQVECRGCKFCIPRCEECGICIKDEETEEAACADSLCLNCWLQLPKCSFCNRPYCIEHADQQFFLPGSSGFLCTSCHAKHMVNSWLPLFLNTVPSILGSLEDPYVYYASFIFISFFVIRLFFMLGSLCYTEIDTFRLWFLI